MEESRLSNILSRRRKKSTQSLTSTDSDSIIKSTLEKFKGTETTSDIEMPKKKGKKRNKKEVNTGKESSESNEQDSSSIITYESDNQTLPPPLSTHPSHIGYLTTSSPLISTKTIPIDGEDTPKASKFPLFDTEEDEHRGREGHQEGKDTKEQHPPPSRGSVASRLGSIFPEKTKPSNIITRPVTPPQSSAPIIVNTPPTPTEESNVITSPSGNMISHRRIRSGSLGPSKLSNIQSAPSTPTPETQGFFSSVISAAQNAANTFNTKKPEVEVESPIVESLEKSEHVEPKELAVKTLGMGDLSLSHLGIMETEPEIQEEPEITEDTITKPRSVYDPLPGDQTPPNGSLFEGTGIHRSGSIRSAIGHRRTRGSSAATGHSTIGAAIVAANSSIARPSEGTPKITGFAVASKKRNRDFHNLFRSVPDDDYLIEDYSCALQREILAHGRLYVSEGHLCFSSNIFGWVTTLVMSFDEIVSVEKRSTALLFKNGLMISTLHAKNVFASFTSRDSTYDLIVGIWKLGHPSLRSSLNGVRIEETGGGDKTEKDDGLPTSQSSESEDSDEGDEVYDEDEEEEMLFEQAEGSVVGSEIGEKIVSRKASGVINPEKPKEILTVDFPGPLSHAPTECTDTHYEKIIADDIIQAPLGKVFTLIFGQASVLWMKNWLTDDQKCLELTLDENVKPLSLENKTRSYSYIKPLNGAIGPKQTKCLSTETLDFLDLEKCVTVTISTQTPDVPSGNVFSTKTRYCLTWGENNTTRMQMNCAIEWTGKSWLKGPIEKGAGDGQVKYAKEIVASLKAAISTKRSTAPSTSGKTKKKGRKVIKNIKTNDVVSNPKSNDWGIFEPIHGIFGPIVDIIQPLLTGNIVYGLLIGLLITSWFRYGSVKKEVGFLGTPERIAAYEEIWRREESELWEWLEDRVNMDRKGNYERMKDDRLKDERMERREMEEAIKVTEEKLKVLKGVVGEL